MVELPWILPPPRSPGLGGLTSRQDMKCRSLAINHHECGDTAKLRAASSLSGWLGHSCTEAIANPSIRFIECRCGGPDADVIVVKSARRRQTGRAAPKLRP